MHRFLLSLLLCLGGTLFAYPNHSPQLFSTIKMLYQLPETQQLLSSVETEGIIYIKATNLGKGASNAAWFPDERTICLNISNKRTQGSLVRSIIFELHNALAQKKFDHLDQLATQGKISKEKYIESVEHLEYSNALKTVQILNKGINNRIFPPDAYWPIASSFDEHYKIQIEAGHSRFIGNLWQSLSQNRKS